MNITNLAFMDTGTYDQMFLRPYEILENRRGLESLQIATNGGTNITASSVAGVAGSVLRPAAQPIAAVQIANGWGTKRYRFFMEITTDDFTGTQSVQYVTGYTDYTGVSPQGNVDPNMRLHIASVIRMKTLAVPTNMGLVNQMSLRDSAHVMSYNQIPGVNFNPMTPQLNLQRPQDLCQTVQTSEYRRVSNEFFDPRTSFTDAKVKLSRRQNSLAPKYLSDVLKAGVMSLNQADESSSEIQLWGQAAGYVNETPYTENDVLFELHRKTSFNEGDSVTYGELKYLCPHLERVTHYFPVKTMVQQQMEQGIPAPYVGTYTQGHESGWGGVDNETLWAQILSNSVPALMMECMLKETFFTLHNHTLDNSLSLTFTQAVPMGRHLNSAQLLETFAYRLQHDFVRDLLAGDPRPFHIEGLFDILGESRLTIGIAGGHKKSFATPTFADNLFPPVLTLGQERVNALSDTVEYMVSNLTADARASQAHSPIVTTFTQQQGNNNASSFTL